MFRLEVTADNGAELIDKLRSLVGAANREEAVERAEAEYVTSTVTAGAAASMAAAAAETQPAKRGPGRPRKNPEPPAPEPVTVTVVEPPADKPSRDDCTYALQEVNNKHGMPRVLEILKSFNVSRISEMKPADYPAFIDACQKAVVDGE